MAQLSRDDLSRLFKFTKFQKRQRTQCKNNWFLFLHFLSDRKFPKSGKTPARYHRKIDKRKNLKDIEAQKILAHRR